MTKMRARLAVLGSTVALAAGALVPVQLAGAGPAAAAASYDWVALGDSYTAGVIPAAGDVFEFPVTAASAPISPTPRSSSAIWARCLI